jgi:hypothetical protein
METVKSDMKMMATEQNKKKRSLKQWLAGDMLLSPFLQRQLGLFLLIAALIIVYVSNRYAFQQELVEIEKLRTELLDVKNEALARSSELMEKSRGSNIQKFIVNRGSELKASTDAPVVIKK